MKYAHKNLIAAGLLAAMGFAATAQTPPPAAPGAGAAPMARQQHDRMDPAQRHDRMQQRMQEHMARRQAALKQKLALTPAQESAWTAYTSAMKPTGFQRPNRAEFDKLTTPERIDRMRATRAARIAEMDKRADATKTFYAALSADQKKLFDTQTARGGRGHDDRGHRHHKG